MQCSRVGRSVSMFIMVVALIAQAATVQWKITTSAAPWSDKSPLQTTNWDNDNGPSITVDEQTTYQEIFGYGGCFNELGWKVLMKLNKSTRDSIMKLLFDPDSGCNFNICRMPLGANDYSVKPYTHNENSNDYTMEKFSIDGDRALLLPYVKAAMAVRPDLKVWGSPWTVPTWMKDSKAFNNGTMLDNAQMYAALALYFSKSVAAYQKEGLHYFAVMPANEPHWNVSMGYPVTGWKAEQFRKFVRDYLGPQFTKDDVNAAIYLGTYLKDQDLDKKDNAITQLVFADSVANSYCAGTGYQYGMDSTLWKTYPEKRFFETETDCQTIDKNKGFNDIVPFWSYAYHNDDFMRMFFNAGVSVYSQWNIVLDTSGSNIANWRQYAMVMVDTVGMKVRLTPQFYQVRHYSYVKSGAYRIKTGGTNNLKYIGFRNRSGENVLVVMNSGNDVTVAINFNGQKIKPTIPGGSFNTFRIPGTPLPIVSSVAKVEAEKYTVQRGVLIRPCSEGGSALTLIENNDWVVYHNVDFAEGVTAFSARVSGAAGTIEVRVDSCTGPALGTCTVPASSAWTTVTSSVNKISGNHELYLKFKGAATGMLFDLNWFQFEAGTATKLPATSTKMSSPGSPMVMCNGAALPSAGAHLGAITAVYDLHGKVVYTASSPSHASLPSGIRKKLQRGVYILKLQENSAAQ